MVNTFKEDEMDRHMGNLKKEGKTIYTLALQLN
jgi:hypothetical protein